MGIEDAESYMKKKLKSLCLSHGWSYGVFWGFDPRNHMLLIMEDAYYEEHAANVMTSMLKQVHELGEGIIGEAVLNGKYRWIFNSLENSQFGLQFSSGIKTIAVIPVDLRGVVQFGSTKEIFETPEFLIQARKFLQECENFAEVTPAGSDYLLSCSDVTDQNILFASAISSQNSLCEVSASWANSVEGCSLFDSLHFPGELIPDPSPESLVKDALEVFSETDDLSQWLADASKLCVTGLDLEAMLSDDLFSDLGRNDIVSGIQEMQACSSQSSLTNALDSCREGNPLVVDANTNELFTEFGIDFGFEAKNNLLPVDTTLSFSECTSEVGDHLGTAPKKGLFSELGLEHLLRDGPNCSSISKSCIQDQWPSLKKRKTEACQIGNELHQQSYPSWGVKLMQPTSNGGQMQDFGTLKECMANARARLWMDESFSVDAKSCISGVNVQSKRTEEPPKATKKRARPGESTRPRPKDRQLISDRIKDLRDLIPNGAKLSIDALLGRTIKLMLFLQNLKKQAVKLKQVNEPKLLGQDNGLSQESCSASISSSGNGRRNATWAYEVGGSNLLCPIIVEDLNEPGQMLIEMLSEGRGYFLQIADIVRGFGLTILKGVMEARHDKIWAHFIVEGNRHITRMDVFMSLMQLLQGTNTSQVLNAVCEPANIVTNAAPLWGEFQQHVVPLLI